MALYGRGSALSAPSTSKVTEFDLLKASHRFLRDQDEQDLTWEDQVAKKYYDNLYREFAVCDLKHYKSGSFALRWRTEDEVISGLGEETCGNTRCVHHEPSKALAPPPLKTVELPFTYEEAGEQKAALVKVVLCGKCLKKLMWKREKDRERQREAQAKDAESIIDEALRMKKPAMDDDNGELERRRSRTEHVHTGREAEDESKRRRSSRSRSPKHRDRKHDRRRKSPS